jgi:uncharacterized DUF497 family protein
MTEKLDLEAIDGFDWNDTKNDANRAKHGIDFDDVVTVFYEPVVVHRSDRNNEERWIAIGNSRQSDRCRLYET